MPLANYNLTNIPNNSVLQGYIRNSLVQGPITSTWNVKSGGQSKATYKGRQDQITNLALQAQSDGFEYTITGGHIWTLEVTFPLDVIVNNFGNEPQPITAWEINNTSIEQNILECKDRLLIGGLSAPTKRSIESNLKNADANKPPVGAGSQDEFVNAQIAQNLKFSGVEGKLLFVPTLKRTIIVSNTYNPGWSTDANGTVMTTATLISRYGTAAANGNNALSALPTYLANSLPTSIPIYINTIGQLQSGFTPPAFIGNDGIVTFVGWLEYPPEYQTISLNKIQISQQWVFNRWSAGDWGMYNSFPYDGGPNPTAAVVGN